MSSKAGESNLITSWFFLAKIRTDLFGLAGEAINFEALLGFTQGVEIENNISAMCLCPNDNWIQWQAAEHRY